MEQTKAITDVRERELFERYARARFWKDEMSRLKTRAEEELEKATNLIVEYLNDCGKKSTGRYDDLGLLTVKAPTPRPKYAEENKARVYEFVRENGGEACIKEAIHPGTFASFLKEKLAEGTVIPEFIEIYYQPSVMYTKPEQKQEESL